MSHHLLVSLEPADPRTACVDYRQPIAALFQRINKRIMHDYDTAKGPRQVGSPEDVADKHMIAEAMDWTPELFCPEYPATDEGHAHPPANRDAVKLAPYRHPSKGPGDRPMIQGSLL